MKVKNVLTLILVLIISVSTFSQKKELKKIEKLINSGSYWPAFKELKIISPSTKGTKFEAQTQYLYGKSIFGKNDTNRYAEAASFFIRTLILEDDTETNKYSDKSKSYLSIINSYYLSSISTALKSENYGKAGDLYSKYSNIYPGRRDLVINTLYCYQQAKNNDKMISVASKLLELDKEEVSFNAKNKQTKNIDEFFKKEIRDKSVKIKTHIDPSEVKIEKKTRINYYNILVNSFYKTEKLKEALEVLKKAKKEFPKTTKFYDDYATIVLKSGDKKGYLAALQDVSKLKPTDKNVWMNIAITNGELNNNEAAIKAYDKVIQLAPKYSGAYTNKALLIMADEKLIIDELNQNLSNNKKHAEISAKLNKMYLAAISSFEKSYKLKPVEGIKATLITLYKATGQKNKATTLK